MITDIQMSEMSDLPLYRIRQIRLIHRFQEEILHLETKALSGVFKAVISCQTGYGLHYLKNPSGGVTVEIRIPYVMEVQEEMMQGAMINV